MNVLVYDGIGVCSLQKTLLCRLRELLKNYDVIPVDEKVLNTNPWEETTSLVVIPGGRDLEYLSALEPEGITKIKRYVERGGSYLGICAGAYFACNYVEFELHRPFYEVIGSRPLNFFPGKSIGSVAKDFEYGRETGADAMSIMKQDGTQLNIYVNGGPYFKIPKDECKNITVLACYTVNDQPSLVECKVERGVAILSGAHLEVSSSFLKQQIHQLSQEPSRAEDVIRLKEIFPLIDRFDFQRQELLSQVLVRLGLNVSEKDAVIDLHSYPIWMIADSIDKIMMFQHQVKSLSHSINGVIILKDVVNDWVLCDNANDSTYFPETQKALITYQDQELQFFNAKQFLDHRKEFAYGSEILFGSLLLYTQAVGSTQTSMDQNTKFSTIIPYGTVFVSSHQTAGRGRGKNSWISQNGCLQFSLRIQHGFVSSIIHIQYLFGLAVVQAIKKLPGCSQMPLHLKWPNDIYCKVDGILKKIGGILITSEYLSESMSFNVTIGCGLNVLNSKPSTCLQDLTDTPICIEIILAAILAEFQQLYDELIHQSNPTDPFGIFRERYYHCWLHTNQSVQVNDGSNTEDMIIRGLDPSGFLKTKSSKGNVVLLQPDGNTFDMLKNLISVKESHFF